MGRIKKYWTEESKIEARKKRQMKYYWKHKKEINLKDKLKYEESKDEEKDEK
jgi:hypothetical protein